MSNRFQSDSLNAYGTRVTSYWLPGHEEAGRAVLQHTAAALRVYSDWFGPYPYAELRVASAPISFRGMEYPQVFLLGVQLYDRYRDQLEIRAVHEVAHQWWYQLVHNDPVNEPWVDEGLAEYSSRIYYEAVHGEDAANILEIRRWQAVVDALISRDEDAALAQSVMAFADGIQYEGIVYGKGRSLFLRDPPYAGRAGIQAVSAELSGQLSIQNRNAQGYVDGVAPGQPTGRRRAVHGMDWAPSEPAAGRRNA